MDSKPMFEHEKYWDQNLYVGGNFEMLVTVSADFFTNILYYLA